jgi:hypothetical protein
MPRRRVGPPVRLGRDPKGCPGRTGGRFILGFVAHSAAIARIAQLVERLICNQGVGGSSPSAGSRWRESLKRRKMLTRRRFLHDNSPFAYSREGFPSGQRDQTVNLTALPSEVRILPPPPDGGG